jgi:hypothetical protein
VNCEPAKLLSSGSEEIGLCATSEGLASARISGVNAMVPEQIGQLHPPPWLKKPSLLSSPFGETLNKARFSSGSSLRRRAEVRAAAGLAIGNRSMLALSRTLEM